MSREIPQVRPVMNVEVFEDGFTVKKIAKTGRRFPFSEKDLLSNLNASTAHADAVAVISNKEFTG